MIATEAWALREAEQIARAWAGSWSFKEKPLQQIYSQKKVTDEGNCALRYGYLCKYGPVEGRPQGFTLLGLVVRASSVHGQQKMPKFRTHCEAGLCRAEIRLALMWRKARSNIGAGTCVLSCRIQCASSRLWVSYNMFDLVLRREERFALRFFPCHIRSNYHRYEAGRCRLLPGCD